MNNQNHAAAQPPKKGNSQINTQTLLDNLHIVFYVINRKRDAHLHRNTARCEISVFLLLIKLRGLGQTSAAGGARTDE